MTAYDLYEYANECGIADLPIRFYDEIDNDWIEADEYDMYTSFEYDPAEDDDIEMEFIGLK